MKFEEPKIEYVQLEAEDIIKTSGGGAAIDICAPGNPNDENDFPCFGDDD